MLTRLKLRNFKSWPDTGDLTLRPITGLFGANSSGKTSLLQALLLLKQTSESSDRGLVFHFGDLTTPVDLGNFQSVVHGHDTGAEMEFALDWEIGKPFKVVDIKSADKEVLSDRKLGFSVLTGRPGGGKIPRPVVGKMYYRVGEARFGMQRKEKKGKAEYDLYSADTALQFIRSVGRAWPLPAPVKSYGFPDQVRAYYQNAGFLADLQLALEECLERVLYLGPLRAYPKRQYIWTGAQPGDMGQAGEAVVDAILASRERGRTISPGYKRRRQTLEARVAWWLKQLGLVHEFRVEPIGGEGSQIFQVKVRKTRRSEEVLITDVGFGVSQILPVLVLCFYVPEGSTVILEQPEIHLHPAVQSGLADVLIDAWKNRKVQIVLESHSEHLLRRLQRRIADETVSKDDVGLFFCSADAGGSSITNLELDMFGNITNWPKDFFGDEFKEIADMTQAAQKRRKEEAG